MLGLSLNISNAMKKVSSQQTEEIVSFESIFQKVAGSNGFLFKGGESIYTDLAKTSPANTPGQLVYAIDDLSGFNHSAIQGATVKRPVLSRHPISGLRNILLNSGFDGATSGSPFGAPLSWSRGGSASPCYVEDDIDYGGKSIRFDVTNNRTYLVYYNPIAMAAGTSMSICFRCDVISGSAPLRELLVHLFIPTGSTVAWKINGVSATQNSIVPVGNGHLIESTITAGANSGQFGYFRLGPGGNNNVTIHTRIYRPQLEHGSICTPYQKTTTKYDVTEVGQTDVFYLDFDGIDDSIVTNSMNFSSNGRTIVAALRKKSDVSQGAVLENLSSSAASGGFAIYSPNSNGAGNFGSTHSGAVSSNIYTNSIFSAPRSGVISSIYGEDSHYLRVNGSLLVHEPADSPAALTSQVNIGSRNGSSLFASMCLYSIFMIDRKLSDKELEFVETQFATEYGIQF